MKYSEIKAGRRYLMKNGSYGVALNGPRYHPPAVKVNVEGPIPWGERLFSPRDILREMDDYEQRELGLEPAHGDQ